MFILPMTMTEAQRDQELKRISDALIKEIDTKGLEQALVWLHGTYRKVADVEVCFLLSSLPSDAHRRLTAARTAFEYAMQTGSVSTSAGSNLMTAAYAAAWGDAARTLMGPEINSRFDQLYEAQQLAKSIEDAPAEEPFSSSPSM